MATRKSNDEPKRSRPPRAKTPEARERELISLAVELAEEQLRSGTASSQVITHYLKLGSSREKLDQEKTRLESKLLAAKTESLESQRRIEELYADAITAMRRYSGQPVEEEEYDED